MPLSSRLRFKILTRDHYRCTYCGATPEQAKLHVDHVVPRSAGGGDEPSNLVTSCETCNLGKGAALLPTEEERIYAALNAYAQRLFDEITDGAPDRFHVVERWTMAALRLLEDRADRLAERSIC